MKINQKTVVTVMIIVSLILSIVILIKHKELTKPTNCISNVRISVASIKNGKRIMATCETSIFFTLVVSSEEDKAILRKSIRDRSIKVTLQVPQGIDTTFGHPSYLRETLEGGFDIYTGTMLFADAEPNQIAGFEALFKKKAKIIVKDKTHEWIFTSCE